ncbi:DUF1549 and DUF1553 domain-containing protein [Limnoglobus roseus]|uniref:DUF1553 domain-containing protein n=1 Tax=Limnoglobus roseus TaxID=2598579 RepID=A0A5C1A694_9BACT|nr:DUF1549 and DUF1553 domain-containing protein [Limnoglobus roseus]QEL13737.1 hypothetical protein PX52LOC_00595 [Limnoglobus roseus]
MRSIVLVLLLPTLTLAQEKVKEPEITAEDRAHWSFVPPRKAGVRGQGSGVSSIDSFIRAKTTLSPTADKLTLIRRVTFDLTGLPPTLKEIDDFVADPSPQAYETVVDRLLASPHFGERWATHWLDVVRFAESNGYELDADRPDAWRYRDYVARSFNVDKPYSTFLREQIAGDELAAGKEPREVADLWIATGMHRCGPAHMVSGNLDREMIRQESLTEMVNGVGAAVLGLTLQCARCHDHKTDPISTADYYRVQAFFAAAEYRDVNLATDGEAGAFDKSTAALAKRIGVVKKQVEEIDFPVRAKVVTAKIAAVAPHFREALKADPDKRTAEQKRLVKEIQPAIKVAWDDVLNAMPPGEKAKRDALRQQLFDLEAERPARPAQAWAIADAEKRPPTHVLRRGDASKKGPAVSMAFPRVLTHDGPPPTNRTQLAEWFTSSEQPLTARVIVNRLWSHYFGTGIVRTVNDFGVTSDPPSHPELLDWLACELMDHDWKLKHVHKLIVMSEAYHQTSAVKPNPADPDNRLLGRQNRKRLDAEAIRDAILTAAGTLNREVGGRSVRVPLEPEVYDLIFTEGEPDGLWPVTRDAKQHTRRSLYLFAKRNVRLPILEAFDQPDTLTPCTGRNVSTFAPQALILMNGPFANEQSRELAALLMREKGDARLTLLYRRAIGREPTAAELKTMTAFFSVQAEEIRGRLLARQPVSLPKVIPDGADVAELAALADVCLAVLNSNEFVYVK